MHFVVQPWTTDTTTIATIEIGTEEQIAASTWIDPDKFLTLLHLEEAVRAIETEIMRTTAP